MIQSQVVSAFSHLALPPELITFFLAMIPIVETRGAIPIAHGLLGQSWFSAFFWAWLGSLIPGVVILFATEPFLTWCNRKSPVCKRLVGAVLDRARKHYHKHHERFGDLGLLIITSLPLPLCGIWTGAPAAVVFGVPRRRALALMAIGNAVAALLVVLATAGILRFASVFL